MVWLKSPLFFGVAPVQREVDLSVCITCLVADLSLCTWETVVAADRLSFLHGLTSSWGTSLTAHRDRHLTKTKEKHYLI